MSNQKNIKLVDSNLMGDFSDKNLKGAVRITDLETNEIVLLKKNIIVYRGRIFSLEKIFNTPVPENFNPSMHTSNNLNRTVCLFTVGTGGTTASMNTDGSVTVGDTGNVFEPAVPSPLDINLHNPIPFRVIERDDIATQLTDTELKKYANPVERLDPSTGKTFIEYYSKVFEPMVIDNTDSNSGTATSLWKTNEQVSSILEEAGVGEINHDIITSNEVFKYITLKISTKDCRGSAINELGLQIAHYDENAAAGDQYSEIELFSRITFPSEPLMSETKKLLIEYFVYA